MHAARLAAGALEQYRRRLDRTVRWVRRRGVADRGPPMSTLHERMTQGDPAALAEHYGIEVQTQTQDTRKASSPSDQTEMEN
jgi:hypothetical protein